MSKQLTEKKQFYLTWSYLHRFAVDPNTDKPKSLIYVLNRWLPETIKANTKTLCYSDFDYGNSSTIKSKELMKITEVPFNRILNLYEKTKNITKNDFHIIIKLIMFMHLRTISYGNNVAIIEDPQLEYINVTVYNNYKILYAQHLLAYPRLSQERMLNLDISKFSKRFKVTDPVDPKWEMTIIEYDKGVFISSDNPVLFFSPNPNTSPISPLMILPITPSKLLVLYHTEYFECKSSPKIDNATIRFINKRLYQRCHYAIYSNSELKTKQIEELTKNEDYVKYDKINIKKLGINLQVDEYPKKGFSFLISK